MEQNFGPHIEQNAAIFESFFRQRLIVICLGGFRVERQFELLFPIEREPRARQLVIAVAGAGAMPRDIGRMRGDFIRDQSLLHVLTIRQAEMLLRRYVTQHGRAVPSDHRRADRRGDVIVARCEIRHQRAERVERRFLADFHFFINLKFDLIHRDVARTFDHHLYVIFPRNLRELAERFQLSELCPIARIGKRARPQPVA